MHIYTDTYVYTHIKPYYIKSGVPRRKHRAFIEFYLDDVHFNFTPDFKCAAMIN